MKQHIDQLRDDSSFQMYALEDLDIKYEQSLNLEVLNELDLLAEEYESHDQPMVYIMDITSVAGVLTGLKSGAIIYGDLIENSLLDRLGLASVASANNNICIARDRDIAMRLSLLHRYLFSENRAGNRPIKGNPLYMCEQEVGRLLGYPETAIEYYLDPMARLIQGGEQEFELRQAKQMEGAVNQLFQHLVLSPDYYEDELAAYTQPLEDATRTLLPNTYRVIERIAEREHNIEPYRELA